MHKTAALPPIANGVSDKNRSNDENDKKKTPDPFANSQLLNYRYSKEQKQTLEKYL